MWEKSQYPKGRTVDGRQFVQVLDDTKDHWAGRTADLSLIAPERSIGLAAWRLHDWTSRFAGLRQLPV